MTSDLRIQGEVVVNSEQAESAFNRVGDKAQQMATEVATSAGKAGQAVDKIGDGAGASAEKFTRAESRISASIKRATNELELLGKTASQRLEFNIADKGLDPKKFEPALQKLREVEAQAQAAQRAASGSLDKMGISAAQTAAALRGVPAQFTDIVTSLQGGQAPLTVFLQQGGQLRDMFGGAGAAARALGGYVLGLVNPFTVAAAAAAALAYAYNQGSKEADAYNKALITTGNAAGTNAAQLKAYAQEISAVVGTQGKAAESLAALASTGKIGAESLKEAAQAAVQYERATGQALDKTADQLASLRGEPLAAVLKLNDGMNFLTDSTYKQIKSLEEQGKTAEAANVAQRAFADTLAGRAGEMERNLGTVERGWLAVKDAAKSAWDAILNVGRASTNVDQLAAVRKQIADREKQLANGGFGENEGGAAFGRPSQANTERLRAELAGLQAQAAALEGVAYASRTAAEEERKRGEQVKATAAFDKAGEKFLTDKARMERELAAARVQGAEAGKSQAEIEQRLAQIRESYAKKGGGSSGIAAENKELRDQMRVFADLAGVSSTYYADLANAQKQRAAGVITEQQYVQAVEALIAKQPFAVAIAKEQADAAKAQAKASEEAARAHLKYVESFGRGAAAAQQQADQLRTEEAAAAIAARGYYSLAQAIELVTIARLEEKRDGLLGNEEAYLAVQKEIDARKELLTLIGSKEARKTAEEAAMEAARDWERAAADINRSLTDALLRGFESGKDFAKNLRDTLVNMFKTLVLRPIIQFVVQPLAGGVLGLLGLPGAANAATGGGGAGNAMSTLSLGKDLYSAITGGFSTLSGQVASWVQSGMNWMSGSGGMISQGPIQVGGFAQGAGAAAGTLAGVAGGVYGGRLVSGGYSAIGGSSGNTAVNVGTAIGSIWGPIGSLVGGMIGGAVNRLFGRKLKDSGIEGTFGGASGFEGRQFEYYKGGLFRSDKTKYKDLDEETRAAIADPFNAMRRGAKEMAGVLGLGTQAIDDFTAEFKVSLKGLSAEEADKRLKEEFDKVAESLASTTLGTTEYTRAGETSVQTLTRLSGSLTGVNQVFKKLGVTLYEASLAGGDLASGLIDTMGGMEKFQTAISGYYENYYSGTEKLSNAARTVGKDFDELGVAMPRSRQELRGMITAALEAGESGQELAASLLNASANFDNFADSLMSMSGLTTDSIKGIFENILEQANSAQEAESMAADAFSSMIIDSMQNAMLTGLSDMVMSSLVAPLMEGMLAGAVTSSTVLASGGATAAASMAVGGAYAGAANASGGAAAAGAMASGGASAATSMATGGAAAGGLIGSFLDTAKAYLTAFGAVMSDPEVQAAIADLGKTFGGVVGMTWTAQQSWGGGGGGSQSGRGDGGGGGGGKSEADKLAESMKKLGDVIGDEIKRLTGAMDDFDPKRARDSLLAEFAINTAKARSGDTGALDTLTKLSKEIENATKLTAASALDLNATRGWLAASLADTLTSLKLDLPKFAVGTNYVPRTMAAVIHEGEAIVPKAFNPWAGGGATQQSNARLEALVTQLIEDNRIQAGEIARLQARVARVVEKWDGDGMPAERVEAVI